MVIQIWLVLAINDNIVNGKEVRIAYTNEERKQLRWRSNKCNNIADNEFFRNI